MTVFVGQHFYQVARSCDPSFNTSSTCCCSCYAVVKATYTLYLLFLNILC